MICDRVRAQVSLQLDGELSELERRMMDSHLARCPACSAFAVDVGTFTRTLREAPLESPCRQVSVRASRRVSLAGVQVGVAAAVAVVSLGVAQHFAGTSQPSSAQGSGELRFETGDQLAREIRQIIADGRAYDLRIANIGSAVPI